MTERLFKAGVLRQQPTNGLVDQDTIDCTAHAIDAGGLSEAVKQLRAMADASPPDDWKWYSEWGDYNGYGNMVAEVDPSNNGDVHGHGASVGKWGAATKARAVLALLRGETP